jgi:hypothetical protein
LFKAGWFRKPLGALAAPSLQGAKSASTSLSIHMGTNNAQTTRGFGVPPSA